jgi:hypothetical protein
LLPSTLSGIEDDRKRMTLPVVIVRVDLDSPKLLLGLVRLRSALIGLCRLLGLGDLSSSVCRLNGSTLGGGLLCSSLSSGGLFRSLLGGNRLGLGSGGTVSSLTRSSGQVATTLGDAGRTASQATQVVQLGTADLTESHNLNLVDSRGVNEERSLDADTMGRNTANCEVLIDPAATTADNNTFEYLDTLAGALNDLRVNANGIAGAELRHVLELLLFNGADELGNHDA